MLVAALLVGQVLVAAEPSRVPLADFVPDDVALVAEIDDLAKLTDVTSTEFYERIRVLPPIADLLHIIDARRLRQLTGHAAALMKHDPERLWQGIFGGRVLFGVWPQPATEGSLDTGVLLIDTGQPELIQQFITELSRGPRSAPQRQVKIDRVEHAGHFYHVVRVEREGVAHELCLTWFDSIGVMTRSDSLMRQVLELRSGDSSNVRSLGRSERYRSALARIDTSAPGRLFVHCRPWDEPLSARLAEEPQGEFVRTALVEAWHASDYWVVSFDLGNRLSIKSYLSLDQEKLDEPLRAIVTSVQGSTDFLAHVPANAVMAYAGTFNTQSLGDLLNAEKVKADGNERPDAQDGERAFELAGELFPGIGVFKSILPHVGSDIGVYLVRRDGDEANRSSKLAQEPDSAEVSWIVGAQIPTPNDTKQPPVDETLDWGLRAAMNLACDWHNAQENQKAARVEVSELDGLRITSLEGFRSNKPVWLQSYTFDDSYFFGGSSTEAVRLAATMPRSQSLAASPRLLDLISADELSAQGHVAYLDCAALVRMLDTHPQLMAQLAAMSRRIDTETAEKGLDQLRWLIAPIDRLVATAQFEDTGLSIGIDMLLLPQRPVTKP